MDTAEPVDPKEIKDTLETYKKLARDVSNHDTILKVYCKVSSALVFFFLL